MTDPYAIVAVGLRDGQQRLEALSLNAAHASVPGYRRQLAPTRPFAEALDPAGSVDLASGPATTTRVDLRPGAIALTGRGLDVAIEGDDLFFALSDGAATWLTRAGAFTVDEAGWLIGERGLRVQGTGGDIRLDGTDVEIRRDGQIVRDGVTVATLQLFKPEARHSLAAAGGALLSSPQGVLPAEPREVHVRGAALESSNAGANTEMVDLLTLTRQVESLVRVAQGYDELLGRTIQKLGEV